jgi:hypothetical protein
VRTFHEAIQDTLEPWSRPWVKFLTAVSLFLTLVVVGTYLGILGSDLALRTNSLSNMSQISVALHLYALDYDQDLPPARNWEAGVRDCVEGSSRLFSNPQNFRRSRPDQLGYGFNPALGGRRLDSIPEPTRTPMLMEIVGSARNLLADPAKPHINRGQALLVFAEGKAKFVPPDTVPDYPWTLPTLKQN